MPNRMIKESICTSDTLDNLTWFEEVVFYRLIVNCDDYGRFDGRAAIIKNRLFPLKENLTIKTVGAAIDKLANRGLVVLYMFEDKPYLYLPTWDKHQTIRAKKSKYPDPTSENICKQMQADDFKCLRNPIQSESNTNPIQEDTRAFCEAVTAFLNQKANTAYRASSKKTRELILARKNEGFTLDDFKTVIAKKAAEWGKEPEKGQKDMRPYLRPETLFGTKFESYLNQPVGKGRNTPKSSQSYDLEEFERYSLQFTPDIDDGGDSE